MKRRFWKRFLLATGAVVLITSLASGCSPVYVIRAGIAEAKILRARRPIPDVILDPATDERTKTKLTFVVEARNYAIEEFELDVGRSYTSFTQLESDTLALVLSAARKDQLTPKTWWFPVVGSVPYKGYFSEDAALKELEKLEDDWRDVIHEREFYDALLMPVTDRPLVDEQILEKIVDAGFLLMDEQVREASESAQKRQLRRTLERD